MNRLRSYVSQSPILKALLKPLVKIYKRMGKLILFCVFKPISQPLVAATGYFNGWADNKPWMPIFYFFLPWQNPEAIQRVHILHNVQIKTGRKVVVISPWRFWPATSAKDLFFVSFVKALTPGIRYIWIPRWVQDAIHWFVIMLLRSSGRYEDLFKPRGLQTTVRYHDFSTIDHTDLLNHRSRVVLYIPKSHTHTLEKNLSDLGVSPHDWFVCVHAREHGWHRDVVKTKVDSSREEDHRNVDIRDYFPAINYIRSKGGMVVRIGDPSMKRARDIDGFVDYPFTEHWGLPMDLFLVSRCRFYLGCCSGPAYLPTAFSTPTLVTNFPGPAFTIRFPYSNILFLTKHVVEKRSGRVLGLSEMFEGLRCIMNNIVRFESMGLQWVSNKPEDILEATKEILSLIETNSFDRERTKEQELFHQLRLRAVDYLCATLEGHGKYRFSNGRSAQSRISATFAARYFAEEAPFERVRSRRGEGPPLMNVRQ